MTPITSATPIASTAKKPRLVVLAPKEERFDGTGGAVATWISRVQLDHASTDHVVGLSVPPGDTRFATSRWAARLDRVSAPISRGLAALTKTPARRWQKALWLKGRLWVMLTARAFKDADVLYVHNRPAYASFARRLGFRGKIIVHMHNDPEPYFAALSPQDLAAVDAYVACSDFIRHRIMDCAAVEADRVRVVYNGVDAPAAAVSPAAMSLHLLYVGRIQHLKGPDVAIDAVSVLREQGQQATLTIVGGTETGVRSTDTDYLRLLRARAAELNVRSTDDVVRFTGPVPLSEVLRLMAEHPILIAPVRVDEAFGMVLVEALSRGATVLAPERGGIPEILTQVDISPLPVNATPEDYAARAIDTARMLSDDARSAHAQQIIARFGWSTIRSDYDRDIIASVG